MLRYTPMYTITVHQPDGTTVSRELTAERCIVGRVARRSDLVVDDPQVSGAHVEITCDGDSLWIQDLNSSNGTALNGQPLEPGVRSPLDVDQQVLIGGGSSLLSISRTPSWEMTQIGTPTYKPRYVGVLYTDIVNSTQMATSLGPERGTALLEWHNEMLRERFKRYNGRETKYTGDGFEAVFASVGDALGCAAACQRALARRNQTDPDKRRLEVRMGVNAGEAPSVRNRVYGIPLILAARVMSKAAAAQVLVPSHVPGVLAGSLLKFSSIGVHDLKGLDDPVELLEFHWELDPNVAAPPATGGEQAVHRPGTPAGGTAPAPRRKRGTAQLE
jgi:class 3 adenylate cyclase